MKDGPARDVRVMTDAEFDEWTNVRGRGIGYLRRKMFFINAIIACLVIAACASLLILDLIPNTMRHVAVILIVGFLGLPWLIAIVFTPLVWKIQEEQYEHTRQLRTQSTSSPRTDNHSQ